MPEGGATPAGGLSAAEVEARREQGRVNAYHERTSRSVGEILRANVLTRFNAILGAMLVVILVVGPPQDALFGFVALINSLIGIVQELRAKRTLDRLAVLSAPRATVRRDGEATEIAIGEVVLDDLVELRTGDQVPADGRVAEAEGLEIDESLLTGESDPVDKVPGDSALSGSIVVAGRGAFQATAVGADAYARRLAAEARRFALMRSELMEGIDLILRYVTWAILPAGVLLLIGQFRSGHGWREALVGVVAGTVAMVPAGLVLLTSLAFGAAAVTLARRKVLVQELPAVEGLARVDVVCLDKTGTLTDGDIRFDRLVLLGAASAGAGGEAEVREALGAVAHAGDRNATMDAVAAECASPGWERSGGIPFSSARKWSAASFGGRGTWVMGAPEMVWADRDGSDPVRAAADEQAATGSRVLLLARTDVPLTDPLADSLGDAAGEGGEGTAGVALPDGLEAVALVLLEENVRPDAAETLDYFREQGVALKVISGDNPRTVGAVAARVGVEGAEHPVDARSLPDDVEGMAVEIEANSVFGRVTPHQKRLMVSALQSRGHVVAMTGDGVNDALALKDADIGMAMGNGAPATRSVAQLVLLDGRFATMPGVVAEGRRVTANIERVSNLFVTKTVYALWLAVLAGALAWAYPFLPRHYTVIDALTIGVPGFFLALAPNLRRYVPGFVPRMLRFTVPVGTLVAAATLAAYAVARAHDMELVEARTTATAVTTVVALWVLGILARPLRAWKAGLVTAMAGAFVGAVLIGPIADFYALDLPSARVAMEAALIAGAAVVAVEAYWQVASARGAFAGSVDTGPGGQSQPRPRNIR
ncbi:MAG: HAD-IC family P-type ATPase [Acidimicrobiia bacterium]|nr:HAD-IC family P-type ATPase [Acidimicrobiia bacterium]